MKSVASRVVPMFLLIFAMANSQSITTQGVLRDGTGHSVLDGSYTMTFRIYDSENAFSPVWESGPLSIDVVNGIYNVTLGSVDDPLNMLESDGSYWLGVEVGSDGEMTPRLKLSTTAYEMARLSGSENIFPGSGNVGIGTTSPTAALEVKKTSATVLKISNPRDVDATGGGLTIGSSASGIFIDNNEIQGTGDIHINRDNDGDLIINGGGGRVGIGIVPSAILHVRAEGDASWTENNVNGLELEGDDQVLYAGVNSTDHYAYIQSVDYGTATSKLALNARGGNVGIGTANPASHLDVDAGSGTRVKISNPRDVTANDGALMIGTSTGGMFLDNNEIQTTGELYVNNDNNSDVSINKGGGNVGIGTDNPSAKLDVSGTFHLSGGAPIVIRRYSKTNDETVDWDTGYSVAAWSAAVIGFSAGYCDVDEGGAEYSWKTLMVKGSDNDWHLTVEGHTHENSPDWTVDVMFIKRLMTDDNRY